MFLKSLNLKTHWFPYECSCPTAQTTQKVRTRPMIPLKKNATRRHLLVTVVTLWSTDKFDVINSRPAWFVTSSSPELKRQQLAVRRPSLKAEHLTVFRKMFAARHHISLLVRRISRKAPYNPEWHHCVTPDRCIRLCWAVWLTSTLGYGDRHSSERWNVARQFSRIPTRYV